MHTGKIITFLAAAVVFVINLGLQVFYESDIFAVGRRALRIYQDFQISMMLS